MLWEGYEFITADLHWCVVAEPASLWKWLNLLPVMQTPRCCEQKEKPPSEKENSGHFDVTHSINDGKASHVPHPGLYGYNFR